MEPVRGSLSPRVISDRGSGAFPDEVEICESATNVVASYRDGVAVAGNASLRSERMTRNRKISLASLLVVLGAGMFLTSPAKAAAAETSNCEATVRSYCQWVANTYCKTGATCTYNTSTCDVTNAQCWPSMM
jgi:hypothetical protein